MYKNFKGRTRKEFRDYNDYKDRPFGLKWGTAFAIDDLINSIADGEKEAFKNNFALPQMNRLEIDLVLSESFLGNYEVCIQLNLLDNYGRFLDPLNGQFKGEAYEDYFVINESRIFWEDVRHIEIIQNTKWFNVEIFDKTNKRDNIPKELNSDLEKVIDEFYQPFTDEEVND